MTSKSLPSAGGSYTRMRGGKLQKNSSSASGAEEQANIASAKSSTSSKKET